MLRRIVLASVALMLSLLVGMAALRTAVAARVLPYVQLHAPGPNMSRVMLSIGENHRPGSWCGNDTQFSIGVYTLNPNNTGSTILYIPLGN
jgi:hypothetical protein